MNNIIKKVGTPLAVASLASGVMKPGSIAEAKIQNTFGNRPSSTNNTLVTDNRKTAESLGKAEQIQNKQLNTSSNPKILADIKEVMKAVNGTQTLSRDPSGMLYGYDTCSEIAGDNNMTTKIEGSSGYEFFASIYMNPFSAVGGGRSVVIAATNGCDLLGTIQLLADSNGNLEPSLTKNGIFDTISDREIYNAAKEGLEASQ